MNNVIEMNKPTVDALRMSVPLPKAAESHEGYLHILYGDQYKPVGYLVHKPTNKMEIMDGMTIYEDRYFAAEALSDALDLLKLAHEQLPGGPKTAKK